MYITVYQFKVGGKPKVMQIIDISNLVKPTNTLV